MWFLLLAYLIALSSGLPDEVDVSTEETHICEKHPYKACEALSLEEFLFPEDEEEFAKLCVLVNRYLECMHKYAKACDINIFLEPGEYESINGLVKDVCNKDTKLHKAFLLSAPCYEYATKNLKEICYGPIGELFYDIEVQMALDSFNTLDKNPEYLGPAKLKCLENVATVSCVAEYAAIKCLTYAGQATIEIARRLHYVTDCSVETMEELLSILLKLDSYRPLKNSVIRTLQDFMA